MPPFTTCVPRKSRAKDADVFVTNRHLARDFDDAPEEDDAAVSCTASAPDAMFHPKPSALVPTIQMWWSHMKYILLFALAVTSVLYLVVYSATRECSRGLTRDVFETHGQTEITRRWMRCYTPNYTADAFKPMESLGAFSVYVVRMVRMWSSTSSDNIFFMHMFTWNLQRKTRRWPTKLYLASAAIYFLVPLIDYSATGYRHLWSWSISFAGWLASFIAVWAAYETRDMNFIYFIFTYQGMSAMAYIMAISNVSTATGQYAFAMKLVVRFLFDPILWESLKAAHRHCAMMSPTPGAGLNTPMFMGPIINQAVFSRLLLFVITNDGETDVITLQLIISLNELMLNSTIKHRDAYFSKLVLGTTTADAYLASDKSEELHAVSCLGNVFSELAAIAFLTPLMAVMNLPSTPTLDDGATRTTDVRELASQCLKLVAIEVGLSFVTMFAQYKFHGVDFTRTFMRAEKEYARVTGGLKNWRLFSYRFWVYLTMTIFFFLVACGTVLGSVFAIKMCPRVRDDGHVYFTLCAPNESRHLPGGPPTELPSILAVNYDWPPWKSKYAYDSSDPSYGS